MLPLAAPLLTLGTKLIEALIPDPEAQVKARLDLLRLEQEGALAEMAAAAEMAKAQAATNTAEATAGGLAALWRPFIGFVCGAVLLYSYILAPLLAWACALWAPHVTPPSLPLDEHLWEIIVGMLGLGGFRSLEKVKGLA